MPKKLDHKSKKCIFMGYGTSGEMGSCLWDPKSHKIIRSHDVIFNEKKMHKTRIKDVVMRRVTFQDVNPPVHDGRRQANQATNVDEMMQPGPPTGSQSRADDSSSIGRH